MLCTYSSHNYTVLVTTPLSSWCHIPEHRCTGSHTSRKSSDCRLIEWLLIALRPAQEYFTDIETSPLPVKGCKSSIYARRSVPLSREGSLSYHTCCLGFSGFIRSTAPFCRLLCTQGDVENLFKPGSSQAPIQSPLMTHKWILRTYSNPDSHGL
jgi:hypothetical protein